MFGRVGRAGQAALKQRQYVDAEPWNLSFALMRSMLFMKVLFEEKPVRVA